MKSTTSLVTSSDSIESRLIKTDALGRMQRTPEQRERILDEYERSGLSGPKFAALCGVKYQTFASWLARLKSRHQLSVRLPPRSSGLRRPCDRPKPPPPDCCCNCLGAFEHRSPTNTTLRWLPPWCALWRSHADVLRKP